MSDRFGLVPGGAGYESLGFQRRRPQTELRHFRHVQLDLLRGALDKWAELWGELQNRVVCGVTVLPEAQRGFKPQCGWPEFLEKMWQLKFYLDSARRFSEPGQ